MLWRVRDFKGIQSADLNIRQGRTTILTGVNSSGKSSIIQSLLLAAQSLHGGTQVVLNGPLVRLGDAQDLVREGATEGAIEITVGLDSPRESEVEQTDQHAIFELGPADDLSSLHPRRLRIEGGLHEGLPFSSGRENARASDVRLAKEATAQWGARDALHLKSMLGSDRRQLRTYVAMQGLRPVAVVQLMNAADVAARYRAALVAVLSEEGPKAGRVAELLSSRWSTPTVREFLQNLGRVDLHTLATRVGDAGEGILRVRNWNPYAFEREWEKLDDEQQRALIDLVVEIRSQRPWVVVPVRPRGFSTGPLLGLLETSLHERLTDTYEALCALRETLDGLGERVQYLGPLRDEPRVVWNHWNELARGLPVGTRGEYSAAVLSRFGATAINYVDSGGVERRATLTEAVNHWLTYLDIGENVAARPQGKLGVGFDLMVDGQIRDLTSVGVGVSQALPLLVGLLSSPADSLFIVEQPELHLHPAVQARLADFMIASRPDVAMIVETHSEAFITRIRRRAAEGAIDVESVDITFVEPRPGGSFARQLEISEFGDLSEWPLGFLSSAAGDVQAILTANIKRSSGAV